jgi:hypothetical protein
MELPALWWESSAIWPPARITAGFLLDFSDEGEAIVQPSGGGRETLGRSEYLTVVVRCPRCGEWTTHISRAGEHYAGCVAEP